MNKSQIKQGEHVRLICTHIFDADSLICKDFDLRQTYNAVVTKMSNGEFGYRLVGKTKFRNWLWSAEQPVAKKIWFKVRIDLTNKELSGEH